MAAREEQKREDEARSVTPMAPRREDSDRYLLNLTQGGLGLPDESYYREDKHAEVRDKYVAYLRRPPGMGGHPVIIDALAANWVEKGATSSNHLSWGELDHASLARDLQDHGFIDDKNRWKAPSDHDRTESLTWVRSKHADDLVRIPLER